MARKKAETTFPPESKPTGPRRLPDYPAGDEGSLDNLLELDKVTFARKKGVASCTLQFVADIGELPAAGWPARLAAYRPAVVAGQEKEGEVFDVACHPKADVKLRLSTIADDTQDLMVPDLPARVSKVKLHAKPGVATYEIHVQLSGPPVEDLAGEFIKALGSSVLMATTTAQQTLIKPKPKAEELPPEAGSPAH